MLALLGLAACAEARDEAREPGLRPVRTAAVTDSVAARPIVADGVLGACDESDLAVTAPGVEARVLVRAGESVNAGYWRCSTPPRWTLPGRRRAPR